MTCVGYPYVSELPLLVDEDTGSRNRHRLRVSSLSLVFGDKTSVALFCGYLGLVGKKHSNRDG